MKRHGLCLAVCFFVSGSVAEAAFILSAPGNDDEATVRTAIVAYNQQYDPDLGTVFDPLGPTTDYSKGFKELDLNLGFNFYKDSPTGKLITKWTDLTTEGARYFTYNVNNDPLLRPLLYYTVKEGDHFNLFRYDPGVPNLLSATAPPAISHVTFWTGLPASTAPVVPAPASLILWSMGGGLAFFGQKLRRRLKTEQSA